ncbi:MAG: hypothetical protein MUF81_03995 [Verrucomicrobia bacterium]|jgi:hypothetical protein|nr:hypothetical protein [Verrucomicrobiota bacterium]
MLNELKFRVTEMATGKRLEIEVPDGWKIFMAMIHATASFRYQASAHALAAMLANPKFEPAREDGEDAPEAYARRAVDYAEALEKELNRRERTAAAETKETTL